jgi:hypothetical protein
VGGRFGRVNSNRAIFVPNNQPKPLIESLRLTDGKAATCYD